MMNEEDSRSDPPTKSAPFFNAGTRNCRESAVNQEGQDQIGEFRRRNSVAMRLEDDARRSLDRHAGRIFTDAEWAHARSRLLEFVTILREWDRPSKITSFRTEPEK
jgi:hypothetical protein